MNIERLKEAEERFLAKYPEGFNHPEMQAIGKKHKMDKMIDLTRESFAKEKFSDPRVICDAMTKIVSRSSMISVFEKPKFKEMVNALDDERREMLAGGLEAFLHGDRQEGFTTTVDALKPFKLAKWSLVTVLPNYYRPDFEVFVKPTTAKGVIAYFELEGLKYKPQPTWAFYEGYREQILEMKSQVSSSIVHHNAGFCGFLMMTLDLSSVSKV